MIRVRATDVRELESAARVRISGRGHLEMSKMLRTAPRAATPSPGTISRFWRDSSMAGELPLSAAAAANRLGDSEGPPKANVKMALPGARAKPHTRVAPIPEIT